MQKPNQYGIYEKESVEELARVGRAYVSVSIAQGEDGLYRYATAMMYSYGGHCGPIFASAPGHPSAQAAKDAAIGDMLDRLGRAQHNGDPECARRELRELRDIIERGFRQPSLF